MKKEKKYSMSDFWGMGTAIGLGAAIGIMLGALLDNFILWLMIGTALGVVVGAITQKSKMK